MSVSAPAWVALTKRVWPRVVGLRILQVAGREVVGDRDDAALGQRLAPAADIDDVVVRIDDQRIDDVLQARRRR